MACGRRQWPKWPKYDSHPSPDGDSMRTDQVAVPVAVAVGTPGDRRPYRDHLGCLGRNDPLTVDA